MDIHLHIAGPIHLHVGEQALKQLGQIAGILTTIAERIGHMDQTVQDLTDAVTALTTAVGPLPAAVDALEAAVTTATNSTRPLSAEEKQALIDATAKIRGEQSTVDSAVADAGDGVDEGAGGTGGTGATGATGGTGSAEPQ